MKINDLTISLTDNKITEIFYHIDEFRIEFDNSVIKHILGNKPKRTPKMSPSEVITNMVMFHTGGFRIMKHFYINYVQVHMLHLFSRYGLIQPICGTNAICLIAHEYIPENLLFRRW